jgi:phosphoribosylformylglycinamidine cyclo-ligase
MAHVTGGGLAENLARVLPDGHGAVVDPSAWAVPTMFDWLAETGGIEAAEMRRTFNLGIGFVLVAPAVQCRAIVDALADSADLQAWIIGQVEAGATGVRFANA